MDSPEAMTLFTKNVVLGMIIQFLIDGRNVTKIVLYPNNSAVNSALSRQAAYLAKSHPPRRYTHQTNSLHYRNKPPERPHQQDSSHH